MKICLCFLLKSLYAISQCHTVGSGLQLIRDSYKWRRTILTVWDFAIHKSLHSLYYISYKHYILLGKFLISTAEEPWFLNLAEPSLFMIEVVVLFRGLLNGVLIAFVCRLLCRGISYPQRTYLYDYYVLLNRKLHLYFIIFSLPLIFLDLLIIYFKLSIGNSGYCFACHQLLLLFLNIYGRLYCVGG